LFLKFLGRRKIDNLKYFFTLIPKVCLKI